MPNGLPTAPLGGTPPAAPHPPHPPAPKASLGRTLLVAAAGIVAGGLIMRVLDRTVLKKEDEELDQLLGPEHPKALAAAPPPRIPRPQIIRVEVPRGTRMPDDFWKRLAGEPDLHRARR